MRNVAILCVLVLGLRTAHAQATAGAARADEGPSTTYPTIPAASSLPPEMGACAQKCANEVVACASRPNATQAACTTVMQTCVASCTSVDDGSSAPLSGRTHALDDNDINDTYDPAVIESSAQRAARQLIDAWKLRDSARRAESEREALQRIQELLQALCRLNTSTPGSCSVSAPKMPKSLKPRSALGERRASDRWSKNLPHSRPKPAPLVKQSYTMDTAPPKKPSEGRADGCYVRGAYEVVGMFADGLYVNTPLMAGFESTTGVEITITNSSKKPAWVGPGYFVYEVPARAGYDGNPSYKIGIGVYRAKNDYRASRYMLSVKYWTDSKSECEKAGGGVHPGPTTPEEFGPTSSAVQEIE